ncbi:hypothetical protein NRB16_16015 [Pseudomonas sp. LJDD11]|uniref:hypothetical protein n=1 Tax=Pseudomonas sp. LJDD11 TaxID=2931984 RepID=UPI00211C2FF0|nr:hypothetical protein [Pseudomonas sp. LJDD11]MCQ9425024.1 hypothetical protein [Pseudomonas sp. LJDD11]
MDNLIFGFTATLAFVLMFCLKQRIWRKWLGIALMITGFAGTFWSIPQLADFDPFNVFLIMWLTGLSLFFERDRYIDSD